MLSIFIIWLYIVIVSFPYGLLWLGILARTGCINQKTSIPIEIILVAGAGVLSVLISIVHLWLPISLTVHGIILAGGLGILWSEKKNILPIWRNQEVAMQFVTPYFVILFILFLLILIHAPQLAINPDTGLYHAQTIQWFQQYPIVPGLGNLYFPLGLNSHAHVLMSFFSFPFLRLPQFHQAWSSFIFFVYSTYALREGFKWLPIKPAFSLYYFVSLLLGLVFFRDWISSPTPDPVIMFFFFILFGLLLTANKTEDLNWQTAFVFFLLPVLISFKLSSLLGSTLGLAWFLLFKKSITSKMVKLIFLQGIIVLAPFLLRNVILSGHLLYPLPGLDVFNLDWEIPQATVLDYQVGISTFARVPTALYVDYIDKPIKVWFPVWWVNQNGIDKIFLILLGILLPFFLVQAFNKIRHKTSQTISIIWLSTFLATVAWFCSAPAVRFGYAFLVPTLLIGLVLLNSNLWRPKLVFCLAILLGLYGLNGIYKQINRGSLALVWPIKYRKPLIQIRQIGKIKTKVAYADNRCWNEPLPCTSSDPHPGLEMRGKNLADGFRTAKD